MRVWLVLLLAIWAWPCAAVASETAAADSVLFPAAASSADSVAGLAAADSTRSGSYLVVSLVGDEVLTAARVEPSTMDFIRVISPDGKSSYIPAYRVRSIRGFDGTDHTEAVLDRHRSVGTLDGVPVFHEHHDFAFRGHPLPETKTFLITHVGIAARVDPGHPSFYPRTDYYGTGDLGLMRNVSRKAAVGGDFYLGGDDRRTRFGPKVRLRYWLNQTIGFDVAPGILLGGSDDWYGHADFPGFVGEASLGVSDIILVTGNIESISIESTSGVKVKDTSVYLGVKAGTPASVGAVAGLAAIVIGAMGIIFLLSSL